MRHDKGFVLFFWSTRSGRPLFSFVQVVEKFLFQDFLESSNPSPSLRNFQHLFEPPIIHPNTMHDDSLTFVSVDISRSWERLPFLFSSSAVAKTHFHPLTVMSIVTLGCGRESSYPPFLFWPSPSSPHFSPCSARHAARVIFLSLGSAWVFLLHFRDWRHIFSFAAQSTLQRYRFPSHSPSPFHPFRPVSLVQKWPPYIGEKKLADEGRVAGKSSH